MKRHLRPSIEKVLIIVTMFLFALGVSINDFESSFMPIYLLIWTVVYANIHIIRKYGNGLACKEDEHGVSM